MPIDFSLIRSGKIVIHNDCPDKFFWLVYFLQNSGVSSPAQVMAGLEFYWVSGSDCRFSVSVVPEGSLIYRLSELLDDYLNRNDLIFTPENIFERF